MFGLARADYTATKREPDLSSQHHGRIGRFHTGHPHLYQCHEVRCRPPYSPNDVIAAELKGNPLRVFYDGILTPTRLCVPSGWAMHPRHCLFYRHWNSRYRVVDKVEFSGGLKCVTMLESRYSCMLGTVVELECVHLH